jgi:hypothetical protein
MLVVNRPGAMARLRTRLRDRGSGLLAWWKSIPGAMAHELGPLHGSVPLFWTDHHEAVAAPVEPDRDEGAIEARRRRPAGPHGRR